MNSASRIRSVSAAAAPHLGALLIGLALVATGCGPSAQVATRATEMVAPTSDRAAGSVRLDRTGIDQVWVPAGEFVMGTADTTGLNPPAWARRVMDSEMPAHPVRLTRGFWIDRFEVTVAAYQAFVDDGGYAERDNWSEAGWAWLERAGPSEFCGPGPEHPVACVTWYEAEAYAAWRGGRLPTDAEWEYAARGPDSFIYPWGNEWDPSRANVVDSEGTTAVGSYPGGASWVGAHDMSGNVMEWVSDWLTLDYYQNGLMIDPQGPASGRIKIEKGGWWGSNPFVARAAYHHFEDPPVYKDGHIGFRVVTED
ncbi:MAG: SUMF1/EgtB/PvdO family nonheme iron enzyme [Rhodothermales bacterium]|nr:SUMF1/EgtB/PvdO family nonheme iron enzyme [Rhodothermales bacterium]